MFSYKTNLMKIGRVMMKLLPISFVYKWIMDITIWKTTTM